MGQTKAIDDKIIWIKIYHQFSLLYNYFMFSFAERLKMRTEKSHLKRYCDEKFKG